MSRTDPDAPEADRLFAWPDVRRLGGLAGGTVVSQLLPRALDPAFTAAWFRLYRTFAVSTIDQIAARMSRHLPAASDDTVRALAERHVSARIEDLWARVLGLHGHRYRPSIEITGLEHLRGALTRGRGVVVWGFRIGSATVLKQAFQNAGVPLHHLTAARHGSMTTTRLGLGVVARLYSRVEDTVLAERIEIPQGRSLAYLQTLSDRLAANRCVSIFGEHEGRQAVDVDVLGMPCRFARGAPSLAWKGDAGLVTAWSTREGPFRHRVVIDEEIPVDRTVLRKHFAESAVHVFAARLADRIIRHPADWQLWLNL